MPKVKTHKGASKRLKKTGSGKLMTRSAGQNHFNSRDTGKVTKNKRRDNNLSHASDKLRSLIPYK
jgi:large subunit ribosomal protein L35